MKTYGQNMRDARIRKGISVYSLAKKTELSETTIRNAETDKHYPILDTLVRLTDALGVTIDEYVKGSGKK